MKTSDIYFLKMSNYPTVVIVTKLNQNPIHGPLTALPTLNSSGLLN